MRCSAPSSRPWRRHPSPRRPSLLPRLQLAKVGHRPHGEVWHERRQAKVGVAKGGVVKCGKSEGRLVEFSELISGSFFSVPFCRIFALLQFANRAQL